MLKIKRGISAALTVIFTLFAMSGMNPKLAFATVNTGKPKAATAVAGLKASYGQNAAASISIVSSNITEYCYDVYTINTISHKKIDLTKGYTAPVKAGKTYAVKLPTDQEGSFTLYVKSRKPGQSQDDLSWSGQYKVAKLPIVINTIEPVVIKIGDAKKLIPVTIPKQGVKITFASGNPRVATIDKNGNLKAVAEGRTLISIMAENKGYKTTVTSVLVTVVKTDAEVEKLSLTMNIRSVFADKNELQLDYNGTDPMIQLPILGKNGSTITWKSSKPLVVGEDGSVTRPYGGDETVTLTANIQKGSASAKKSFTLTVKTTNPDGNQADVDSDLGALKLDYNGTDAQIALVKTGAKGSAIDWSFAPTGIIDRSSGSITRPAGADVSVTVTATVTKGSAKAVKTFNLVVKKADTTVTDAAAATDAAAVQADRTALTISYNGTDASVSLPSSGTRGSKITWTSSAEGTVDKSGNVTRPTDSDKTVTLTAALTKGTAADTKAFTITVKKAEPAAGAAAAPAASGGSAGPAGPTTPVGPTVPTTQSASVSGIANEVMKTGASKQLTITTTPADATVTVQSSSAAVTASVTGHTLSLTAAAPGNATITVNAQKSGWTDGSTTFAVTVKNGLTAQLDGLDVSSSTLVGVYNTAAANYTGTLYPAFNSLTTAYDVLLKGNTLKVKPVLSSGAGDMTITVDGHAADANAVYTETGMTDGQVVNVVATTWENQTATYKIKVHLISTPLTEKAAAAIVDCAGTIGTAGSPENVVLTAATTGTVGPADGYRAKIYGDLHMNASMTLQNVDVTGKLTLDPGAAGEVTLKHVTVGSMDVLSGASHTVGLIDTDVVGAITVSSSNPSSSPTHITADGNSTAGELLIHSGATFDNAAAGNLGSVAVGGTTGTGTVTFNGLYNDIHLVGTSNVQIGGNAALNALTVEQGAENSSIAVSGTAGVGTMNVDADGASLVVGSSSASSASVQVVNPAPGGIGSINVNANGATIGGDGGVGNITVGENVAIQPGVEGYVDDGHGTATVQSSVALAIALQRSDITTIQLDGAGSFHLVSTIEVSKNLTMKGINGVKTIISAGNDVIHVQSGGNLTLDNITLAQGSSVDGIKVEGTATLTMTKVSFDQNLASALTILKGATVNTKTDEEEIAAQLKAAANNITVDLNKVKVMDAAGNIYYPDSEALNQAAGRLALDYSAGDSSASVKGNIALPTLPVNAGGLSWASSNAAAISNAGVVTRSDAGDAAVKLTATLTKGTATKTTDFNVTVKVTDKGAVQLDCSNLNWNSISGEAANKVKGTLALKLPKQSEELYSDSTDHGTLITWGTDHPQLIDLTNGAITRPDSDVSGVSLWADVTKGAESKRVTFTLTILQSDASIVQAAKQSADLNIGYSKGDSRDKVTSALTLPTSVNGVSVQWSSDTPAVINSSGAVIRPSYTVGDKTVTLTATLRLNNATDSKSFTIVAAKADPTNQEACDLDAAYNSSVYLGQNGSAAAVDANLNLITMGKFESSIAWSSSDNTIVSADGTIMRPSHTKGNKAVTLTAVVTAGSISKTTKYTITVLCLPETQDELSAETVAAAKAQINWNLIKGNNTASNNVLSNLSLPSTLNGATVTWTATPSVCINKLTGEVTRQSSNTTVTLSAQLQCGNEKDSIAPFTLIVKQSDSSLVDSELSKLDIPGTFTENYGSLTTSGTDGVGINWTSSDTNVINPKDSVAYVFRPTDGDKSIILTATASKSGVSKDRTFIVDVPISDNAAVANTAIDLAKSMDYDGRAGFIKLPSSGLNGAVISNWTSSNTQVVDPSKKDVNGNCGVTRPSAKTNVVLSATITKGDESLTLNFNIGVEMSYAVATADARNVLAWNIIKGSNAEMDHVTDKLKLVTAGFEDTTITWSSSKPAVIAADGTVTRGAADENVVLTATISRGNSGEADYAAETKSFSLAVPMSDGAACDAALSDFTSQTFLATNKALDKITDNLTLSSEGANGTTILWSTDQSSLLDVNNGKIKRALLSTNKNLTLYAVATRGGASSAAAHFNLVLLANPMVVLQSAYTDLKWDTIKKANTEVLKAKTDLTLPLTLDGVDLAWSSDQTTVIGADGKVTLPAADSVVRLTATLSKSGQSMNKYFVVMVSQNVVETVKQQLAIGFTQPDTAATVSKNLTLPTSLANYPGVGIVWSSDNVNLVSTTQSGIGLVSVDSDSDNRLVTLTAAITETGNTSNSATKVFTVYVPKSGAATAAELAKLNAVNAISALPAAASLKLADKAKVDNAKALYDNAVSLKAVFDNKTTAALNVAISRIGQLTAAKTIIDKIDALPMTDKLTLKDESTITGIEQAINQNNAALADLTNLQKLRTAENRIVNLKQVKTTAIAAAMNAIDQIMEVKLISVDTKGAAGDQIAAALSAVATAELAGAVDSDITNLSKIAAAEAAIASLMDAKAKAITAANALLAQVPAAKDITVSDKNAVDAAEQAVSAARAKGALDSDFVGFDKISAARAMLNALAAANKAKTDAIAAAKAALAKVPSKDDITTKSDLDAVSGAITLANSNVKAAIALGAAIAELTGYSKIDAADSRLEEVRALLGLIAAANAAIDKLPDLSKITPDTLAAVQNQLADATMKLAAATSKGADSKSGGDFTSDRLDKMKNAADKIEAVLETLADTAVTATETALKTASSGTDIANVQLLETKAYVAVGKVAAGTVAAGLQDRLAKVAQGITSAQMELNNESGAQSAVEAAEKAALASSKDVLNVQNLIKAGKSAIANVSNTKLASDLTGRLNAVSANVLVERAVEAAEAAPLNGVSDLTPARGLITAAQTAVNSSSDAAKKTAWSARLAAAGVNADAEQAVEAAEAASLNGTSALAQAHDLITAARTAVNKSSDTGKQTVWNTRLAVVGVNADAEQAVEAAEAAPLTGSSDLKQARSLITTANTAVTKSADTTKKTAWNTRLTAVGVNADAEQAVEAAEAAPLTGNSDLIQARSLITTANTAVNNSSDTTKQKAWNARLAAVGVNADAEQTVEAAEAAPLTGSSDLTKARSLITTANTAVNKSADTTKKTAWNTRLAAVGVNADAEQVVEAAEAAPLTGNSDLKQARSLITTANTAVNKSTDTTKQTAWNTRLAAVGVNADAEQAVEAAEAASLTGSSDLKQARSLITTANTAVNKSADAIKQTAWNARLAVVNGNANAEQAVEAAEAAPLTGSSDLKQARSLITTANTAVNNSSDTTKKTAWSARLAVVSGNADAEQAVEAAEAAPLTGNSDLKQARSLITTANTAVTKSADTTKQKAWNARLAVVSGNADAEQAVEAAEAAPLTGISDLTSAGSLITAAQTAVNKSVDAAKKTAWNTRLSTVGVNADAEQAVEAAEAAPLNGISDLTSVRSLITAAQTAVNKSVDVAKKTAWNARLAAAGVNADAEQAVEAAEAASLNGTSALAQARGLITTANTAVNKSADSTKQTAWSARLAAVSANADAEQAVEQLEAAPLTTLDELDSSMALLKSANDAVSHVADEAKAAFNNRIKVVTDKQAALQQYLNKPVISTVSAVDGTITVTFGSKQIPFSKAADYGITKTTTVNGASKTTTVNATAITVNGNVAKLTVPQTTAGSNEQQVYYKVVCTGSQGTSTAYTVGIASVFVPVSNALTGLPADPGTISDAAVLQGKVDAANQAISTAKGNGATDADISAMVNYPRLALAIARLKTLAGSLGFNYFVTKNGSITSIRLTNLSCDRVTLAIKDARGNRVLVDQAKVVNNECTFNTNLTVGSYTMLINNSIVAPQLLSLQITE